MDSARAAVWAYLAVFGGLVALTALTVAAASVDLGGLNVPLAVGIAGAKATLVALFFMHVRHAPKASKLFSAAGFFWLLILLALTFADLETRRQGDGMRRSPRSSVASPRSGEK